MKMITVIVLLTVLSVLPAEDTLKLSGYLESSLSVTASSDETTSANSLFRLEGNYEVSDKGKVEVHLLYHYSLQPLDPFSGFKKKSVYDRLIEQSIEGAMSSLDPADQLILQNLLDLYSSKYFVHLPYSSFYTKDRLVTDRALVKLYAGKSDLTFGKQQIAWGTGYAFNPTDIWNIKDPLSPESPKIGVSAVSLQFFFGDNSSFQAVSSPGSDFEHWKYGVRLKSVLGRYEYSFSAVRDYSDDAALLGLPEKLMLGADFAGETFFDAGIFGEIAVFNPRYQGMEFSDTDSLYIQFTAGIDYTFKSGLYFLAEYYHNGLGEISYKDYGMDDFLKLTGGAMSGLGKNYAASYLSYRFLNDYTASILTSINTDDGSAVFVPALEYAFHPNILLNINCSVFAGSGERTEYGGLLNRFSLSVKGYF